MEDLVGPCDLESSQFDEARGESHLVSGVEGEDGLSVLEPGALKTRRDWVEALEPVVIHKGKGGEPVADLLLPAGMDGRIFTDVEGGDHPAVGNHVKRFLLRFAEIA